MDNTGRLGISRPFLFPHYLLFRNQGNKHGELLNIQVAGIINKTVEVLKFFPYN